MTLDGFAFFVNSCVIFNTSSSLSPALGPSPVTAFVAASTMPSQFVELQLEFARSWIGMFMEKVREELEEALSNIFLFNSSVSFMFTEIVFGISKT